MTGVATYATIKPMTLTLANHYPLARDIQVGDILLSSLDKHPEIIVAHTVYKIFQYGGRITVEYISHIVDVQGQHKTESFRRFFWDETVSVLRATHFDTSDAED